MVASCASDTVSPVKPGVRIHFVPSSEDEGKRILWVTAGHRSSLYNFWLSTEEGGLSERKVEGCVLG
jgi:hypothetical protein